MNAIQTSTKLKYLCPRPVYYFQKLLSLRQIKICSVLLYYTILYICYNVQINLILKSCCKTIFIQSQMFFKL